MVEISRVDFVYEQAYNWGMGTHFSWGWYQQLPTTISTHSALSSLGQNMDLVYVNHHVYHVQMGHGFHSELLNYQRVPSFIAHTMNV